MSTIQTIADWCTTTVLKRSDVSAEAIEMAREAYQLITSNVPFEALQVRSSELPLVGGTGVYNLDTLLAAVLPPPGLPVPVRGIMSIRYTAGPGRSWRLRRSHSRVYDAIQFSAGVDARSYARFGREIELMPVPSSSVPTLRVRYWTGVSGVTAGTTLVTPEEWDALLKWETLYRLYYIIGEPEKAMSLVQPAMMPKQATSKRSLMQDIGIIPRLWNDLLRTISQRENIDEDFSINPVMRAYTYNG